MWKAITLGTILTAALMLQSEIVVAKNSGGAATYGKMAAARALCLAVILLRRPALPETLAVETVDDAVAWLDHASALPIERGV